MGNLSKLTQRNEFIAVAGIAAAGILLAISKYSREQRYLHKNLSKKIKGVYKHIMTLKIIHAMPTNSKHQEVTDLTFFCCFILHNLHNFGS